MDNEELFNPILDILVWNECANVPAIADEKENKRIIDHIKEELTEFSESTSKAERVDALIDSIWVITNMIRAELDGDIGKVADAFIEVSTANYDKFFDSKQQEKQLAYANEVGYNTPYIEKHFGEDDVDLCCIKDGTGKVKKPLGWHEPDWSWLEINGES